MSQKTVNDVQIAYIGGGSQGWAWGLMSDLAMEKQISGKVKLYDIHYDAAYQNEVIGNQLNERSDVVGKWRYEAVRKLEDALEGANFVIISILPGTFEEMKSDVHLPEKYGIYQSVGDTVGPGGLIRALRTIPLFVKIAEHIQKYAPKSWVINYTNPMSLCTRALYHTFPEIKAIGCCHEVFGTQKLLAQMVELLCGIEKVSREEIEVNVLGINHFTWIDQASYTGKDLLPLYREFVDKYYETGYEGSEEGHWMNNHFASAERVKFDLFKRFKVIAAAGDRHLAEFMPNTWYLENPQKVKEWKFGLTPVQWRIENKKRLVEKGYRLSKGEESFQIDPTGEEGVEIIKSLLGLRKMISNVNIPNTGQMKDVPLDSIVETNAIVSYNSVRPVLAGKLPAPVHKMIIEHIYNQETILQAALTKDKEIALQAFLQDPLVSSNSPEQNAELFEEMLSHTKNYLEGWNIHQKVN
ncbi:family 4 glycosyl hydrolase [Metabacillus arenae]|uniref:Alpha-glucosidase/alpha-galactosidase n=1 Tax=Metabacillus arenae TaxID=2771434 RepID=A0A926NK04_9BACI|nr:alpha-glucosidase/alpha-galactosidase [Metabacillus arenae]MBD1382480.1 alpha-glucosidase/alpha-galactosidase [Metabacillus arenae]